MWILQCKRNMFTFLNHNRLTCSGTETLLFDKQSESLRLHFYGNDLHQNYQTRCAVDVSPKTTCDHSNCEDMSLSISIGQGLTCVLDMAI